MSFTTRVSRTVRLDAADAFAKFTDFRLWRRFMPRAFEPVAGPDRVLRAGDRLRMRIDSGVLRIPVAVEVHAVKAPGEIVWGGGNGLLEAEHCFFFDPEADGGTRIRSEERWSGALTRVGALARRIERQAEIIAAAQLGGFARFVEH